VAARRIYTDEIPDPRPAHGLIIQIQNGLAHLNGVAEHANKPFQVDNTRIARLSEGDQITERRLAERQPIENWPIAPEGVSAGLNNVANHQGRLVRRRGYREALRRTEPIADE
jgi:hypothetical protein